MYSSHGIWYIYHDIQHQGVVQRRVRFFQKLFLKKFAIAWYETIIHIHELLFYKKKEVFVKWKKYSFQSLQIDPCSYEWGFLEGTVHLWFVQEPLQYRRMATREVYIYQQTMLQNLLLFIRPSFDGRIMVWRCPSVRPYVRPSVRPYVASSTILVGRI